MLTQKSFFGTSLHLGTDLAVLEAFFVSGFLDAGLEAKYSSEELLERYPGAIHMRESLPRRNTAHVIIPRHNDEMWYEGYISPF